MINNSKLLGKKAKIQLLEDGVLPVEILHVCRKFRLNPVALIDKEFTIVSIEEGACRFEWEINSKITQKEHISLKEIPYDGQYYRYPKYYELKVPTFPSEFFQIAIVNHPLTNIFQP